MYAKLSLKNTDFTTVLPCELQSSASKLNSAFVIYTSDWCSCHQLAATPAAVRLPGANGPPDEPHTYLPITVSFQKQMDNQQNKQTNKQPRAVYAAGLKDIPVPRDLLIQTRGKVWTANYYSLAHANIACLYYTRNSFSELPLNCFK